MTDPRTGATLDPSPSRGTDTLMPAARAPSGVSMDRLRDVELSERSVLALAPWTLVGASTYVLFQTGALSAPYGDALQVPVAYLGTAVLAGITWAGATVAADRTGASADWILAGVGTVAGAIAVGVVLSTAEGDLRLAWPLGGVVGSTLVAGAIWGILRVASPRVTDLAGGLGLLALFGQVLDGILTAIGIDVFGFGERSPLSRLILEFAAELPTAEALGSGWLLLTVKTALGVAVLWLLADTVEEDPTFGRLLLAAVAAVGLGPGLHNALLFVVARVPG